MYVFVSLPRYIIKLYQRMSQMTNYILILQVHLYYYWLYF